MDSREDQQATTSAADSKSVAQSSVEKRSKETTKEDMLKIGIKRPGSPADLSRSKLREALLSHKPIPILSAAELQPRQISIEEFKFLILNLSQRLESKERTIRDLKEQIQQLKTQRDSFKILYEGAKIENQLLKGSQRKWTESSVVSINLLKVGIKMDGGLKEKQIEEPINVEELLDNESPFIIPKDED